jgi:hypothetical protein
VFALDDVRSSSPRHVDRLAAAIRLPGAPSDLADRNGARLPVSLLVLFHLAAARTVVGSGPSVRSATTSRASVTTSSSPTTCSGITLPKPRAGARASETRIRKSWVLVQSRVDTVRATSGVCSKLGGPFAGEFDIFFGLEAGQRRRVEGTGQGRDRRPDGTGDRDRRALGYGVTGNFVIDPAGWNRTFERCGTS